MLKISDRAFSYLSSLDIPEVSNLVTIVEDKVQVKESKARGFYKNQKWNKFLNVSERCNFNTILSILDGKIILKDEIHLHKFEMLYEDPQLNFAVIFDSDSDFANVRKKCRNNAKLKIVKNVETEYLKHITDFFNCGNFKILLVAGQNLNKDEEIFVSPDLFRNRTRNDTCMCTKSRLCLSKSDKSNRSPP
ncbi:histone-lysine N-methyltransferase [Pseudoloma neurophilia]|uniref:Histone-lysine N-methyltransferase n=1 Tax=Pseudoloma neurophilia TaxID=146866 RepID=A0A0R0M1X7_9MICR|nr:histone-lysine N-methyltransferase [Pseudoloma neurophilia]